MFLLVVAPTPFPENQRGLEKLKVPELENERYDGKNCNQTLEERLFDNVFPNTGGF